MRKTASLTLLVLSLLAGGCAGSILVTLEREAELHLQCDCEESVRHQDISAAVDERPPDHVGMARYYRARCCGQQVFLECRAFVREHHIVQAPPAWRSDSVGDVYWRCWTIEDPTEKEAAEIESPLP